MALIKRLEDEDKEEASLDELKKEVKKDKELKALDPKAVEKKVIVVNKNRLAQAEKRWKILTEEQRYALC